MMSNSLMKGVGTPVSPCPFNVQSFNARTEQVDRSSGILFSRWLINCFPYTHKTNQWDEKKKLQKKPIQSSLLRSCTKMQNMEKGCYVWWKALVVHYWLLIDFDIWYCVYNVKQLFEAKVTICSSGLFSLRHMLLCLALVAASKRFKLLLQMSKQPLIC